MTIQAALNIQIHIIQITSAAQVRSMRDGRFITICYLIVHSNYWTIIRLLEFLLKCTVAYNAILGAWFPDASKNEG